MSDFVQVSSELFDAWQLRGDITTDEAALAVYLAFRSDYRTRAFVTTLKVIHDDLALTCSIDTIARRLATLREHGFVTYESKKGQRRPYEIVVTEKLVFRTTSARPPHDFRKDSGSGAEVITAATSAQAPAKDAAKATNDAAQNGATTSATTSADTTSLEVDPEEEVDQGRGRAVRPQQPDRPSINEEELSSTRKAPPEAAALIERLGAEIGKRIP